ncbi:ATP-binding protein [Actinophytocola sp.]|uniref:sensor histidine kinase n=1 Tax=Actinophytocola sp. TaxID=1872138 RepID=UPI002ED7A9DD
MQIGLSLLAVVLLGGSAGVLAIAADQSRALVVSLCVVGGCVIAVLVALVAAMSAARAVDAPATRQPQGAAVAPPYPVPTPSESVVEVARRPQPAPLWSYPDAHNSAISDDPSQRREVFVKLARRLQSLINRAIKRIDELEQENEDPVLLDGLYEIDHLFTLARRQGENLAVLGGEAPQRRSNRPVSVYAVLLAAVSEAEHYRQIAIVPVEDVEIHGHAVAEIIHLLAELLENATRFTSPDGPKVEVRAQKVTAGLAIEVQDRGLGMSYEDLERINHLLAGSTRIDISELLQDGRIGLAVVRELARRHDIKVRLQSNIFGGVAAAVVIPHHLLGEPESTSGDRRRTPPPPVRRERRLEHTAVTATPEPPAPLPLTAARVAAAPVPAAAPGLGPVRPGQSTGRRHRAESHESPADRDLWGEQRGGAEAELPELPVRAPGRSYDDLRSGRFGEVEVEVDDAGTGEQTGLQPPPLPQRRGTHLREELLEPPAPPTPMPGHNTRLMATVQEGREHWLAEQNRDAEPQQSNQGTSEGDSAPWPTT